MPSRVVSEGGKLLPSIVNYGLESPDEGTRLSVESIDYATTNGQR